MAKRTKALVDEVLTRCEVLSLLNKKVGIDDYFSILKGEYTTWDNEVHSGYIVHYSTKIMTPEETNDYYFMEVTLEEVVNPNGTCHLWEPIFHKLMPITDYIPKPRLPKTGDMKDLCKYIADNACRDKWKYTEVPMTEEEIKTAKSKWYYNGCKTKLVPLTYNDIYCHWSTPLTEEEQRQREATLRAKEKVLINIFSNGELPPAESEPWYGILSMGYGTTDYDLECKVIKILKNRGYSVHIDGERDSFGWVTRGIFVNGQMMAIY